MDGIDTEYMTDDERVGAEALRVETMKAQFASLIANRKREAIDAREASGIEEIWQEDEDQFNGFDELSRPFARKGEAKPPTNSGQSRIYINITEPKTNTIVSKVTEMCLPYDERPWMLDPTPVPELSKAAAGEDDRTIALSDGKEAPAKDIAQFELSKIAEACEQMAAQFEDWFVEGSVYSEMRHLIEDAARLGTGVIKGPVPIIRQDRKWSMEGGVSQVILKERVAPTSKRIRCWDLYPDPACGDNIHKGGYLIERDYLTARGLRDMAKSDEYDTEAITQCLREGPKRRQSLRNEPQQDEVGDTKYDSLVFEVYHYYGDIPVEQLALFGLGNPEEDVPLELQSAGAIITTVNDRIVKAELNPLETDEFPFDVLPWRRVEGQVWGRGVPRAMRAAQRGLVAAVRRLMTNAGISAGAQIVIADGQVEPADGGDYSIEAMRLWKVSPDETGSVDVTKAFGIFTIPSMQKELMEIIQFFVNMAEEAINLPQLMQGNQAKAPDTVGVMQQLEANASSPLRAKAKQADDLLFVPHLKRYYSWAMQDPLVPETAKGDYQVWARAASELALREGGAVFAMQAVQMAQDPEFEIDKKKCFAQLARGAKQNPADFQFDEDELRKRQEQAANSPPPEDPKVTAVRMKGELEMQLAQAKHEAEKGAMQFKAQQADMDRQMNAVLKDMDRQIQMMEMAASEDISLADIKAELAKSAMKMRNDREMFDTEILARYQTGAGI